jgi:hypothetical protein
VPPNETQISSIQETNKIKLKTDGERPKKDTITKREQENRSDRRKKRTMFQSTLWPWN